MRVSAAALLIAAALPGAASAATVGGTIEFTEDGGTEGTILFDSGHAVENRVEVDWDPSAGIVITERAERLRAFGDCEQAGPHRAVCRVSEDPLRIEVGSKRDRVEIDDDGGPFGALVLGGGGRDVLVGDGDVLFGERGRDLLIGSRRGFDRIHGGPGRDRMEGRGHSPTELGDEFFDDETDSQAARDLVIGGGDSRATIDYSMRKRPLDIDVRSGHAGPERDVITDVKSVTGGAGDDTLIGSGGSNRLIGGRGDDRLLGNGGDDSLHGGTGDDVVFGGGGDDRLSEFAASDPDEPPGGGRDRFIGGAGRDAIESLESLETEEKEADEVRCDARDEPVMSDAADRLRGCGAISGWPFTGFEMEVQPSLTSEGAAFTLSCGVTEIEAPTPETSTHIPRCRGRLAVRSADGDEFGSADFVFEIGRSSGRAADGVVTVPLSAAGRRAISSGALVEVEAVPRTSHPFRFPAAGYRARLSP